MAEQANEKKESKSPKTVVKVVLGLVLIALGILAIFKFWGNLLTVISGCIGLFLIMAGAITVAIARE